MLAAGQVQFKRQQEEGGGVQRIKARLMLVDLAGSERASLAAANSMSQKQAGGAGGGVGGVGGSAAEPIPQFLGWAFVNCLPCQGTGLCSGKLAFFGGVRHTVPPALPGHPLALSLPMRARRLLGEPGAAAGFHTHTHTHTNTAATTPCCRAAASTWVCSTWA